MPAPAHEGRANGKSMDLGMMACRCARAIYWLLLKGKKKPRPPQRSQGLCVYQTDFLLLVWGKKRNGPPLRVWGAIYFLCPGFSLAPQGFCGGEFASPK